MTKKKSISKDYWGYIFIAPFVIIFVAFIAYPIYNTFWLAFTDSNLTDPGMRGDFVGFANFTMLFNSGMFRTAVGNTWLIWMLNFIPQMILALVLAAIFSSTTFKLKGTGFFKAMYYLPNLMMPVTIAALFSAYLSLHGPINQFLVTTTGIMPAARDFLTFITDTRFTVVFIQTWLWFGQTAIVLVAGMTSISPTFYESAMIDGASQTKMFFYITLPLLKPVVLFVLITSLVGGLGMFDIPMLLTGPLGAPSNSILTMNMYMNNRRSFPAGMIGSAASVSVTLFFMSSFIALILFRIFSESTDEKDARKAAKRAKNAGGAK
ncbi:MAG: sugar ABC transporter permease [Defluviitaleaceae bacterium]|nr:sugar ABC transporter permease [Defluviitaleaceae bacterium]